MKGDVEAMELLFKAGADINHRDCNGMSALMLACQKGQQAAVEFLLAHGADPSFKDGYDRTAETFASQLKGENGEKLRVLCAGKKK
jgi:ankyrin repeat protein